MDSGEKNYFLKFYKTSGEECECMKHMRAVCIGKFYDEKKAKAAATRELKKWTHYEVARVVLHATEYVYFYDTEDTERTWEDHEKARDEVWSSGVVVATRLRKDFFTYKAGDYIPHKNGKPDFNQWINV